MTPNRPTPLELLRRTFGLQEFLPGQQAVIDHLLAGRSAAAVFPTGGGKSLCYQLPALLLPGVTLVVSPLLALMKEQVERLVAREVPADRLDSTRTWDEVRALTARLRGGQVKLLYVAPERLNNERFREILKQLRLSMLAVDEAHCISEWGHNFRPDYLKLAAFARQFKVERVLALTATATPQVLADIRQNFAIAPECAIRTGFHRPNLELLTTPVATAQRDALLLERLRNRPRGPTVVYVTLQKTAAGVAQYLAAGGLPAKAYHAGMEDEQRVAVQDEFAGSDEAIVVATIAFGMGIDKANIRAVYHYNLPKSLENYAQEVGRDGRPSVCEMLVCPDDLTTLENFIYGDAPTPEGIQSFVAGLFGGGDEVALSTTSLSFDHDVKPLVLGTLLAYLELDGYLEARTPLYSSYSFRPLATSQEILGRFAGERRDFLATLFRQARKAKIWLSLDVEAAARATNSTRERVIRALDYLGELKLMEVRASGLMQRYRVLQRPTSQSTLAALLYRRTAEHERREVGRLQQVLELAGDIGCQVSFLGQHFGEAPAAPCGHCSWCLTHRPIQVPARPARVIPGELLKRAAALAAEMPDELGTPRALARLLCGLSSPRTTRAKLRKHELFGSLEDVPFGQVLQAVTRR